MTLVPLCSTASGDVLGHGEGSSHAASERIQRIYETRSVTDEPRSMLNLNGKAAGLTRPSISVDSICTVLVLLDIGGNWMFRITAFVLAILAVGSIAASSIAQAQKASDPKSQPGSGQCRLSNGQRC